MQTTAIEVATDMQAAYPQCIKESKSNNRSQAILWALIAVVLFVIYYQEPDKSSTLGTIQITLVALFGILSIVKLVVSNSRLIYVPTGGVVEKHTYNFNIALKPDLLLCLEEGNVARLRALKTDEAGGLLVELLESQDHLYIAARIQKYEPCGYVAITGWITMKG